jgi:hypothetical protein
VRAEYVTEHCRINDVGVGGMDADTADMLRLTQAHMRPCAAGVRGSVDPIAIGHVETYFGLAGARIDHIVIGAGHGDRTDGRTAKESVGNATPVDAAVNGLPDAAGAGPEVEHHRIHRVARDRDDTPPAGGADAAPPQGIEFSGGSEMGPVSHCANGSFDGQERERE